MKHAKIAKNNDLVIATIFSFNPNEEDRGDEHSRDSLERMIKDYNGTFKELGKKEKTRENSCLGYAAILIL